MSTLFSKLAELEKLESKLYGTDFLLTAEKTDAELAAVIGVAEVLKQEGYISD